MNFSSEIDKLLQSRLDTYIKDKSVLVSLFGEENRRSEEYNGRQLLELIQNAEDEVSEPSKGDVYIELTSNRLIVANHGNPFTLKGIQSLMTPNVSPKLKQKNKIGVKGLGFRSILTWANSIKIISKDIAVQFSSEIAVSKLKELYEKHPDLEAFVKDTTDEPFPISTLSVPQWLTIKEDEYKEFDTYIIIDFDKVQIEKDIQRQIDSLGPEVMLFLSNLTGIQINSPKTKKKIVRANKPEDKTQKIITYNEEGAEISSKEWTVYSKNGNLPEYLRIGDHKNKFEFELKIAVAPNLDDNINKLFSYFKTEVQFPFPALIHGTFDLSGDRNQLILNNVNRFLLSSLAELMVNTALELTNKDISWNPIKLVALNKESNDRLTELGFNEALKKEILSKPLFPINEMRYAKYSEKPKWYDCKIAEVLPYDKFKIFGDLLIPTNDYRIKKLLTEFGENKYTSRTIIDEIDKINSKLSIVERAELMVFCNRNYSELLNVQLSDMPSLILDQHQKPVSGSKNVIMPPERSILKIPEGIEVSFMDKSLFDALSTITKKTTGREIVYSISKFNVVEYAFDPVIRELIRLANQDGSADVSVSVKVIKSLFTFFKGSILNTEKAPAFPKDVNVTLIINNEKQNVSDMYIGSAYPNGYVNSLLFNSFKPSLLIPPPDQIGLESEDISEVQDFLKWIGVKEYPSLIKKKIEDPIEKQRYLESVLNNITFPVISEPYKEETSEEEVRSIQLNQYDIEVQSVEYLEEILTKNDSESILTWLNTDPNIASIILTQKETNGTIGFWLKSKQSRRYFKRHEVRSYILWKISQTAWLKSSSGEKQEPHKLIRDKTFKSFSPLINVPEIDYNHISFREVKIGQSKIDELLRHVGTNQGFDTIEDSLIYQILNKLESVFPDGDNSRMIYAQILQTSLNRTIQNTSNAAIDYFKKGKVFARKGNLKGYQDHDKVYYMPNSTFCKDVLKKFWIFEMDKRRSKERIHDIFGVKPLDVIRFHVHDHSTCRIQDTFETDLELLKPKLYVYRFDKDSDRSELTSLRKLKIILCSAITADYSIGEDQLEKLEINDYEFIQDAINNSFYIKVPISISNDLEKLKSDVRLAESISDIFNSVLKVIESKKDFIYLFSLMEAQREIVLKSEFGENLQILEEVKTMFGSIRSQEKLFWEGLLQACGVNVSEINNGNKNELTELLKQKNSFITAEYIEVCADKINYKYISSPSNYPILLDLFTKLAIDIETYNSSSIFQIDFTELYFDQIRSLQIANGIAFHNALYSKLKLSPEKQSSLFTLIKKHDQFTNFKIVNSFLFDPKSFYFDWLENDFDVQSSDLIVSGKDLTSIENVREKGTFFLDKYSFDIDLKTLIHNMEFASLLIYEKYEELKIGLVTEGYTENGNAENTDGVDTGGVDILNKAKDLANSGSFEIADVTISSNPENEGNSTNGSRSKKGSGGSFNAGFREETGLLAEAYTYELLKRKHGADKVIWISGNAEKAGVILSGDDGKGYDMELHLDNEIRYIEVKGTSTDRTEFIISNPEVNFGLHKSNYDLILVTNVKVEPKFYRFPGLLVFDSSHSFLENEKFTVHNESYKIRLNIDAVKTAPI